MRSWFSFSRVWNLWEAVVKFPKVFTVLELMRVNVLWRGQDYEWSDYVVIYCILQSLWCKSVWFGSNAKAIVASLLLILQKQIDNKSCQ